jgi:CheY-like chemotaxis protein
VLTLRSRGGCHHPGTEGATLVAPPIFRPNGSVETQSRITVFLADDNLIVREGVRALLALEADLEVVGVAADYDELVAEAEAAAPQVLVTDIRMPPSFQSEGIDAAKELRRRHPGTGVVVLSQYDDPEYAVSLLGDGAAGYGYVGALGGDCSQELLEPFAGSDHLDVGVGLEEPPHAFAEQIVVLGEYDADRHAGRGYRGSVLFAGAGLRVGLVSLLLGLGLRLGVRLLLAVGVRRLRVAAAPVAAPAVGLVEAGALQDDPGRAHHLPELSTAAGAFREGVVLDRLPDLEFIAALVTAVVIGGH